MQVTIDHLIDKLIYEKQHHVTSRFPCRAIMVKNIGQYCELLSRLKSIGDVEPVPSDALFSAADVMPRYENLRDPKYQDRWMILPGVSEYLRLFSRSEATSQRFAKIWHYQTSGDSLGRILIPLWGCEAQWRDASLSLGDDIRQEEFYLDCVDVEAPEQQMDVLVFSEEFEQYVAQLSEQHGQFIVGLQEWYEYWMAPISEKTNQVLLTKRVNSIQPTIGNITIRVVLDTFSFVKENLQHGQKLTRENCPNEALTLLFHDALAGKTLDQAILDALNLVAFAGVDVMNRWKTMSAGEKQLVVLWLSLHPDNTYLCRCFENAADLAALSDHILHDIFSLRLSHPEWVKESQHLINVLGLEKDDAFFAEVEKIPTYEERLAYLAGSSKAERIYLLRLVGKWLREDPNQAMTNETLQQIYPELAAYLGIGCEAKDQELARYFELYKAHKLENTLPLDEETYFSGIQIDDYESRYAVLSRDLNSDTFVLWVDALGVEWLPLLEWALKNTCKGTVKSATVSRATLPTETCYNEQWKQMTTPHDKLDKLDKLAHKGIIDDPDYYVCIEEQIAFVVSLAKKVNELLKKHRVIITGDHGTSRLAARFFHKRAGVQAPAGATVGSHGRYCQLTTMPDAINPALRKAKDSNGNQYLVYANYDHFTKSGFATGVDDDKITFGEIHAGATPEEALVPVIVIDGNEPLPLTASWHTSTVKIRAKKATVRLIFNRDIETLQAKIGTIEGVCAPVGGKNEWEITFSGVASGDQPVSVAADGALVTVEPLTVQSAIGGDGDLPW